jgi:uncharacterized membrane protein YfcA
MMEGIILLLIGLFSGAYGIMVGAGGGFILVPALLIIMKMPPEMAAGTGLVVVFVNALSGVSGFAKQKRIDYPLTLFILIGALPGSFIGVRLAQILPTQVFYGAFAVMLIFLGIFLLYKNRGKAREEAADISQPMTKKRRVSLIAVGVLMGIVSTFFGIGGGWLMVPILIYIYKVAPHRATATSIFSLLIYSMIGVALHVYNGHVDWNAAIWGGAGAMIGAQIGVFISNRIPGKLIIQFLSFLLLAIGVKMLF